MLREQHISEDGIMTGTTVLDLVEAPIAGRAKKVNQLSVNNPDSSSVTLTVVLDNNGTERRLWKGTLLSDETLFMGGITLDNANKKITGVLAAEPAATQPDFTVSSVIMSEVVR